MSSIKIKTTTKKNTVCVFVGGSSRVSTAFNNQFLQNNNKKNHTGNRQVDRKNGCDCDCTLDFVGKDFQIVI